jgi:hypothetical protein
MSYGTRVNAAIHDAAIESGMIRCIKLTAGRSSKAYNLISEVEALLATGGEVR